MHSCALMLNTRFVHKYCCSGPNTVVSDSLMDLLLYCFQIFVKDNQGGEETTVINNIGLFGTPRDISFANLVREE